MKHTIIITLCLLLPVGMNSQDRIEKIWNDIDSLESYVATPEDNPRLSPWSFSTTVGTAFGFNPYFGSSMQMYMAPQVTYAAAERLSFHGGLMLSRSAPMAMNRSDAFQQYTGFSGLSAFVSASYRVTENLSIHGTGIKSMALLPADPEFPALEYTDFSVGATYDFGNFSIGATIHRSDNPYYRSPFGYGNNGMGNPLFW